MLIDIHAHAFSRPGPREFCSPEQLLDRYDEIGVDVGVLLPLVSPEVYLPQSNEEVLSIVEEHDDRFLAFCNLDPRALTNTSRAPLADLLDYYRDAGCRGVGEVMPNLTFLDPMVQNLFHCAEMAGLPLTFDMSTRIGGAYGLYDEPGLPQLELSLRRYPDLRFFGHGPPFWAEIGALRRDDDRGGYPSYGVDEEGAVPRLLREYPNLHGDLSAGSGYNALARDREYAARFLGEFQDRLMFGLDICAPDQGVPLVGFLDELLDEGSLSSRAFAKITYRNAERVLDI